MFARKPKSSDLQNRLIDLDGKMAAIGRSQAVIEFNLDGTIIDANQNFMETMGVHAGGNPRRPSPSVRRPGKGGFA